jgi:hypothetical protein
LRHSNSSAAGLLQVLWQKVYVDPIHLSASHFNFKGAIAMEETPDKGRDYEELAPEFTGGHVMFSPSAVVFAFSDDHRRQASKCLRENGEIKLSFRDISVTDLSEIRAISGGDPVVID